MKQDNIKLVIAIHIIAFLIGWIGTDYVNDRGFYSHNQQTVKEVK